MQDHYGLFTGEQLARSREVLTKFKPPSFTTTERDAIVTPENGMVIYNTTTDALNVYVDGAWIEIADAADLIGADSFAFRYTTTQSLTINTTTDITSYTKDFDTHTSDLVSSGVFTAPYDCIVQINVNMSLASMSKRAWADLILNSTTTVAHSESYSSSETSGTNMAITLQLDEDDELKVQMRAENTRTLTTSSFSGHLITKL